MIRLLTSFLGRQTATPAKPAYRFRPSIEGLEGRALMAAHITAAGLVVDGTAKADAISVGTVTVGNRDYFEVNLNGAVSRFRATSVPRRAVVVNGLGGDDTIACLPMTGTFAADGGAGNDLIYGGAGNDTLAGGAGNDTVYGLGGNDDLAGRAGADRVYGGPGQDVLTGAEGNDFLYGGNGDGLVYGGDRTDGGDRLDGGAGDDWVQGDAGDDTVAGGAGNDALLGADGNDVLLGGAGDDGLYGYGGNDVVNGGAGSDLLYGDGGDDMMIALDGGVAPDYADGGAGADVFWTDRAPFDRVTAEPGEPVQQVAQFANGADLGLDGDRLADPTDGANYKDFRNAPTGGRFGGVPLFGRYGGPQADDVREGAARDDGLMAGLAAVALKRPEAIRRSVVDFGDGTYGVSLGGKFWRVDGDLATLTPGSDANGWIPTFAGLGGENAAWVAVVEKAFALHRAGANSYLSLAQASATEAYQALGFRTAGTFNAAGSGPETAVAVLDTGLPLCLRLYGPVAGLPAPADTAVFSVIGIIRDRTGRALTFILRNPRGADGFGAAPDGNGADGTITLSADVLRQSNAVFDYAS